MTAHVRASYSNWGDIVDPAARPALDRRAIVLAARLAAVIVNPLGTFPGAVECLPPLAPKAVEKMARNFGFKRPLRKSISGALGLGALRLPRELVERFCLRSASRLCALLVTEPFELVDRAALDLSVAVAHRRILAVILKAERARLRQWIGDDRFEFATQQAPLLHRSLADLQDFHALEEYDGDDDAENRRSSLTNAGYRVLGAFVAACEPSLLPAFALRRPSATALMREMDAARVGDVQREQIVKLLRRRIAPWSAIIG